MADTLNWLLRIAYDGTAYNGWQVQRPGVLTIQGILERRLKRLYGQPLRTFGVSRTDSGVHALDQRVTVHAPATPPIPVPSLRQALNHGVPPDIRILDITEMPIGFHARHDAVGKAYTYLIHRGNLASPFHCRYCWPVYHTLDVAPMRLAAAQLIGTHDFTAFSTNTRGPEMPDPVKTLHLIEIAEHGPLIRITVIGNSFLYRMMRRIAGYLVSVGRGYTPAEATTSILLARDRAGLRETAPPQGLFLDRVFYDQEEMLAYRRTTLPYKDLLDMSPWA